MPAPVPEGVDGCGVPKPGSPVARIRNRAREIRERIDADRQRERILQKRIIAGCNPAGAGKNRARKTAR